MPPLRYLRYYKDGNSERCEIAYFELPDCRICFSVECNLLSQIILPVYTSRSSYRRCSICSIKKLVLKNFTKFTGQYVCQSLFK